MKASEGVIMGTEEWGSTIFLVLLVLCGAKPLPKERQEVLWGGAGVEAENQS